MPCNSPNWDPNTSEYCSSSTSRSDLLLYMALISSSPTSRSVTNLFVSRMALFLWLPGEVVWPVNVCKPLQLQDFQELLWLLQCKCAISRWVVIASVVDWSSSVQLHLIIWQFRKTVTKIGSFFWSYPKLNVYKSSLCTLHMFKFLLFLDDIYGFGSLYLCSAASG